MENFFFFAKYLKHYKRGFCKDLLTGTKGIINVKGNSKSNFWRIFGRYFKDQDCGIFRKVLAGS